MRLLLVEDQADLAANVADHLAGLGHDVQLCADGETAFSAARNIPLSQVVLWAVGLALYQQKNRRLAFLALFSSSDSEGAGVGGCWTGCVAVLMSVIMALCSNSVDAQVNSPSRLTYTTAPISDRRTTAYHKLRRRDAC
jgi:CheY-like chemotaxis protein